MANFSVLFFICIAVALAVPIEEEELKEVKIEQNEIITNLSGENVLEVKSFGGECVPRSCRDCNVYLLCFSSMWTELVFALQCPPWSPYCDISTGNCVSTAPSGCADIYG